MFRATKEQSRRALEVAHAFSEAGLYFIPVLPDNPDAAAKIHAEEAKKIMELLEKKT